MLANIREEIQQILIQNGRNTTDCVLLAVSKKQSLEAVVNVFHQGVRNFGENYLQEGLEKMKSLPSNIRDHSQWHMIGPVQSNKAKQIAAHFDWVQSVSSVKLARRLSDGRGDFVEKKGPLHICLQVNIDNSPTKNGVAPELSVLCECIREIEAMPHLKVRGLLVMPDTGSESETLQIFQAARQLFDEVKQELSTDSAQIFDTLSMGMSGDFKLALAAGSTMVRIGTAIFGDREANKTNE